MHEKIDKTSTIQEALDQRMRELAYASDRLHVIALAEEVLGMDNPSLKAAVEKQMEALRRVIWLKQTIAGFK